MSQDEVLTLKEQVKTLFHSVAELKADVKEIKEELANRLPTWATMIIAILTALLGGCIGYIVGN